MPNKQPEFTHHIRQDAGVFIVSPRGHLDSVAARGLKPKTDELLNGGARRVVFDCRELAYLSLSGLGIMLAVAGELQRRGGRFAVCNMVAEVLDTFRLSRMDRIIPIFDSLDAALAASRMARSGTAPNPRSAFVSRRSLVNRLQGLNFDVTVANLRVMPRFNPWNG